jgi:hypothetical protein
MPHFMSLIDNTCLGALNFVDNNMQPTERKLTIIKVDKDKPPAGGKERWCFHFKETDKKAFFATKQIKRLANLTMSAETDGWAGWQITVTCGPVKLKGEDTMGMLIKAAVRAPKETKPNAQ